VEQVTNVRARCEVVRIPNHFATLAIVLDLFAMKLRHWITAITLLLLVAMAIAGMVWTRALAPPPEADESTATPAGKKLLAHTHAASQQPLVDQRPLQTARRMAALATTPEELRLAHEAEKVGDHEVDLAFADALRTAALNPPKLTPEAKELSERKTKTEAAVNADQATVALLTRKLAAAAEKQKDNLQDQLDVAKAQLELDQDELDDAAEDLERAGGDPQAKIRQLQQEHESGGHNDPTAGTGSAANTAEQDYQAHTLLSVFRAWRALRAKKAQLEDALQETVSKQQRLGLRHGRDEKQVEQDKEDREAAKQRASGFANGKNQANHEDSQASAQAAVGSLKHYTDDQRNLADIGKRLQDEQELNDIYRNWVSLVEIRERAALHNMTEAVLWILVVMLAVYLADRLIDRLFTGVTAENKRIGTLRAVVRFAAQIAGAIVILFVVFGMPSETTTILGLAGAGLTVAMKDFIVAFFGWFVLMGRNGIRVGDWVEINGVAGEVVEIGLLKTVLLETGNWTDSGHPTGRRVSFVNSFAMEDHFFNFSSSGQWMWDELQLTIPADQDPYSVIDGLQKLVAKDTEENARKAEEEWHSTTTRYRVQAFSATPAINVRPIGSGVEVRVRYITRAYERHETRQRLYDAVVALMHGKREEIKQ
jgi:small-conductance mechanosensitive channel